MAQRKVDDGQGTKGKDNSGGKKPGKPISLDASLKRINKKHASC
jgi:hypothetical protein